MTPEQRLAARLVRELGLRPPVDVEQVARRYAKIEEDRLPGGVDAVVIGLDLKAGRKPTIVLQYSSSAVRKRFSLAHEIGHVLIPWHIGLVACHTQDSSEVAVYGEMEGEANRFASELLLPSPWLDAILRSQVSFEEKMRAVLTADISRQVACLALVQRLPPGFIFAVTDAQEVVTHSGRSPGTTAMLPVRKKPLDFSGWDRFGERVRLDLRAMKNCHWWRFDTVRTHRTRIPGTKSTALLEEILQRHCQQSDQRDHLRRRINGIIGAAKSTHRPKTVKECVAVLRSRFSGRPDLAPILNDSAFETFLWMHSERIVRP
jgi:hypothetical protein